MVELIIWKKQEIDRLKKDMDRLLTRFRDDFCSPLLLTGFREEPYLELSETQDELFLKAEIPGLNPKDLDITISDDLLTIKGEAKQESFSEDEGFSERVQSCNLFSRTIQLPCKVHPDEVRAIYQDGILSIVMPKLKPEKARGIKIKVT
ncbi:MAG: Hsp20/alpha crystallin family protein [Deltaproteobacteria bacterium]